MISSTFLFFQLPLNWFALASVPLYLGAGVTSWIQGDRPMAGMWTCYALANGFLVYAGYLRILK